MKSHTEYLTIQTKTKREFRSITEEVKAALKKSEFAEGLLLVSTLHANSAVVLGLNDPNFFSDLDTWLEKQAPTSGEYQLKSGFESSPATVLQSMLAGTHLSVAFSEGRLDLGPWQEILYLEFDGQRPKRVVVKLLGE